MIEALNMGDCMTDYIIEPRAVRPGLKPHPRIKNIIAVASGKGGVGKSTTAVNLALALAALGARVGVLDADIYGPSQPLMLGAQIKPHYESGHPLTPVIAHGLESMSMGYLVDVNTPMVWRGPMVSKALQQLLFETHWSELDYLVVDLPPGTGDIQLTMAQKIPVAGAIIVTTPQDLALLDARKGLEMFHKVQIPVLGIVENMSVHVCSECGHEESIFGAGGGEKMAKATGVTLLGTLPLDKQIREDTDGGAPTVISAPESSLAQRYRDIALKVIQQLALQPKSYAGKFPDIVVE
jgi:ATP-binding protein involved in chromosome partitioning